MGREIRKVPAGWDHPRDERGHYRPLFDQSFEAAADEWVDNFTRWQNGTHQDFPKWGTEYPYYWQWDDNPPNPDYYRPAWPDAIRTHFQVYETVSEGTPTSPVFATEADVVAWLVGQGHSQDAATAFVKAKSAPSFVIVAGRVLSGINAMGEGGTNGEAV